MDDKELLQSILISGVVRVNWDRYFVGDTYLCDTFAAYASKQVAADSRVTMALMEKCLNECGDILLDIIQEALEWTKDGMPLSRALNENFMKALGT